MRKKGLLPAVFLLFLSASLLAHAASASPGRVLGQDQPQRPKFYALQIVSEKSVQNAKDALGPPDGRYAEILPGGQLVLFMEKKLYSFPFGGGVSSEGPNYLDSGSVLGKGGMDFRLEGWFVWHDTQGKQRYDWMALGLSTSGFFLCPTYPVEESVGVDMIRISNPGTGSLFVDAVIGLGKDV